MKHFLWYITILTLVLTAWGNMRAADDGSLVVDTSQCVVLKEKGNECITTNQYAEALKYYTLAMEQAERSDNKKIYRESLNNIGLVYAAFRDYERAVFYFERANQLSLHSRDERLVSLSATNLMAAYCAKDNPEAAENYLRQLENHPFSSKPHQDYYLSFNRGLIASCKKQYRQALEHLNHALDVLTKSQLGVSPSIWYEMGNAYLGWGKQDSALVYYSRAIELAQHDNNFEEACQAYKALSEVYKNKNLSDSAVKYQTCYINLQDSLFNINKFNLAKAELFDYENELVNRHISSLQGWIWILAGIVLLVLAVLAIITYLYRQLQSAQWLLVRKNEELIAQNEKSKQLRADYVSSIRESSPGLNIISADVHDDAEEVSMDNDSNNSVELPFSREQKMLLLDQITQAMENPDVIIDPDFNLNKLAKMVNSNTKYVSAIINDSFQKSFKALLNENRIREVCRRLGDEANYGHLTIAAIANSVGYNSMNNFIMFFKRIVGMTPSKYRQLALKNRQSLPEDA